MPTCLTEVADGVEIRVKVVPGSSRDRIVGPLGECLKIQVSAAPERGKANAAVIALLAEQLRVSMKDVRLLRGTTSPNKVFFVRGISIERAAETLGLS